MNTFQIVEKYSLTRDEMLQLMELWNQEYPVKLAHPSLQDFNTYFESIKNVKHFLLVNPSQELKGWACTFDRDDRRWFAIILSATIQSMGYGKKMMAHLQSKEPELFGWVTDHDNDVKSNGEIYRSPLVFYQKCGFEILAHERLETEKLSAVKIRWSDQV